MGERVEHEISHGEYLASGDTEALWEQGTPASRMRAQRRAQLIADAAQLRPETRVLEIGCGTGMFTERKFRRCCPRISEDETAFVRSTLKLSLENVGSIDCSIVPFDGLHPAVPKSLIPFVSATVRMLEKNPLLREFY